MPILEQLSHSKGQRDESANLELAAKIAAHNDSKAIVELVDLLKSTKTTIQNDLIKVLYEVAALKPSLIAVHLPVFLELLQHPNNRLQWGAMAALAEISRIAPNQLAAQLPRLAEAAERGSVITRDNAVRTFVRLAEQKKSAGQAIAALFRILTSCPVNQLPLYAEMMEPITNAADRKALGKLLEKRLQEPMTPAKQKRLKRILKKQIA